MTAEIIQIRDHQKRDKQAKKLAVEIINVALIGDPATIGMEFGLDDTAPCEMNPDKEPA